MINFYFLQLKRNLSVFLGLIAFIIACPVIAHDNHDHDIDHKVSKFIDDMVTEHQFSEEYLRALIGEAKKKDGILNAFTKPATSKPWSFFRKLYVTEWREKEGVKFWNKHSETLARAEEVFGIPQDIITALIGIETNYGTYTGEFRILDAFYTLGFFGETHSPLI